MKIGSRIFFAVLLFVAAGLGFSAWRERVRVHTQREELDARLVAARRVLDRTQRECAAALRELATQLRSAEEAASSAAAATAPPNSDLAAWDKKVATLRSLLAQHREWAIPEIELFSPDEFIFFARDAQLDGEEAQRKALSELRALAKRKVTPLLREALDEYVATRGGRLPADIGELTPLLKTPLPEAVLKRYAFTGLPPLTGAEKAAPLLYERTPVDERYDTRQVLDTDSSFQFATNPEIYVFTRALDSYAARNAGRKPAQLTELAPYLEVPLDPATLARYFNGWQTEPATLQDRTMIRKSSSDGAFHPRIGAPRAAPK